MTAELAVAVPAVLLVLAACLGGLRLGVERLRLVDAAGQGARAAVRDEDPAAAIAAAAPGVRLAGRSRRGDLECVAAGSTPVLLGLPIALRATSCALGTALP